MKMKGKNINEAASQGRIQYSSEGKTIQLPLEDGTMYSQRKGVCPAVHPFSCASVEDYAPFVGEQRMERLIDAARKIRGVKVLELNSAPVGGGVAEMLLSSVPFLNQLGIDDEWKVIRGSRPFYEATKGIHSLLQGRGGSFSSEMERVYFETLKENVDANVIDYDPDIVLVHDPQPLGLSPNLHEKETRRGRWLWRCHIDMDEETLGMNPDLERFMNYWIEHYDGAIVSAAHYVICRWPFPKFIIPPFIDPLSEKNRELSQTEINAVLEKHGIDPKIPIITQVGRFDPWKGLMRTVDTYRIAKKRARCQLVLAGGLAADDPEGEVILAELRCQVQEDPDIHILCLPPTASLEINAIQRASQVVMQPSIKEGFGLTVTEALWKRKPVIASQVGGLQLQLRDADYGYFYNGPQDAADKIVYLLTHPKAAELLGRRGSDYVRDHFLLPDRVADYLKAIVTIMETKLDPESIISFHSWHKLDKRR